MNVSSIGGRIALPLAGPYAASKFALEAFTDSLRRELRHLGVEVIAVEPGGVKTPDLGQGHRDRGLDARGCAARCGPALQRPGRLAQGGVAQDRHRDGRGAARGGRGDRQGAHLVEAAHALPRGPRRQGPRGAWRGCCPTGCSTGSSRARCPADRPAPPSPDAGSSRGASLPSRWNASRVASVAIVICGFTPSELGIALASAT